MTAIPAATAATKEVPSKAKASHPWLQGPRSTACVDLGLFDDCSPFTKMVLRGLIAGPSMRGGIVEVLSVLVEVGDYKPTNHTEFSDLMNLAQFGPPRTELYWRWATALKHSAERIGKAGL
jgi:hypothetical protein